MKKIAILALPLTLLSASAFANYTTNYTHYNEAFSVFNDPSWNEFSYSGNANMNGGRSDGIVGPGGGGQTFDAEYLFYKYDSNTKEISIGLQTGFDINDGHKRYGSKDYYAGDLALSFDGDDSTYEYAIDFGLLTKTYNNGSSNYYNPQSLGTDTAGLYQVSTWNNDIANLSSSPFAMETGTNTGLNVDFTKGQGHVAETYRNGYTNYSYYRVVTFDLSSIVDTSQNFTVDAHWTMSCGNDDINGAAQIAGTPSQVPEPSIIALIGLGSIGIFASGFKRRKLVK